MRAIEIIDEITGDSKFDTLLSNIVTPSKPTLFKRIRGFLTPDVDKTARSYYERLAEAWGKATIMYWEVYKNLQESDPRYPHARIRYERAMSSKILYDMLSGKEAYDETIAQMLQQKYNIDPRDKLPSI
jgi:hypothetical protein